MQIFEGAPFESEVRAYEEADRLQRPPKAPVLFYGSSSIRFWPNLEQDSPGRPVLNRGFGGATLEDCVRLFHRLVKPYAPRVIVLYAGDNDLAHGQKPLQLLDQLKQFLELLSKNLPSTLLAVISIKPSPLEWDNLPTIRETNALIRLLASKFDNVAFLDVFEKMCGPDGSGRRELFENDGVHMAPAGYAVWKDVVMSYLTGEGAGFHRERHKWFSPHLKRDMELLVLGRAGHRVLVFPTLYGSPYQYEELGMVEVLRDRLERDTLQLFCLDSLDLESWYDRERLPRDRVLRHLDFENYVLQEAIPFSHSKNADSALTGHGCSLGAFHAVNFAFRHPDHFSRVLALSGRYDLTKGFAGFRDLLDGYYDDDVYFNTPCHFMPNLTDPRLLEQLRRLDITIVIGESDAFIENNRALSQTLWDKGVWHTFHVWNGYAHNPHRWCEMVRLYL
jgi:esterase/lipase superfamily enzyme/lysophospholipase L1-like esterase